MAQLSNVIVSKLVGKVAGMVGGGDKDKMYTVLLVCIVLIMITFIMAFNAHKDAAEKRGEKPKSMGEFLGLTKSTFCDNPGAIAVAMASNIVFGFVDNAGLFFGMDALDPVFEKLKGGNHGLINAGYGNTFSDAIGAFLGTFIGSYIADKSGIYDGPLWAQAIGIVIGCILGVYIPAGMTGAFKDAEFMEENDISYDDLKEAKKVHPTTYKDVLLNAKNRGLVTNDLDPPNTFLKIQK